MIPDVDTALQKLLEAELPKSTTGAAQVSFAAPDQAFPGNLKLPALDLFLYDVRENTDLRDPSWLTDRGTDGSVRRLPPPVRVDCSYLVTAWAADTSSSQVQDEHRLLSDVIGVVVRFPVLPERVLGGALKDQAPAPPVVALGPGRLQSVADFWHALGGKPKAALHLTVTVGVIAAKPVDAASPPKEHVVDIRSKNV